MEQFQLPRDPHQKQFTPSNLPPIEPYNARQEEVASTPKSPEPEYDEYQAGYTESQKREKVTYRPHQFDNRERPNFAHRCANLAHSIAHNTKAWRLAGAFVVVATASFLGWHAYQAPIDANVQADQKFTCSVMPQNFEYLKRELGGLGEPGSACSIMRIETNAFDSSQKDVWLQGNDSVELVTVSNAQALELQQAFDSRNDQNFRQMPPAAP